MGGVESIDDPGGYRVFKVYSGGPVEEAGLEVFFDFIIEVNGHRCDPDQRVFLKTLLEAENKRVKLVVRNIRVNTEREVFITPRRWGGVGLLGAVVRYDSLLNSESQGIRVLEVLPNSPAQQAGLVPYKDYLLGTTEVMFREMDELVELVKLKLGQNVQVYVYSSDSEKIREVTLIPRTGWGGDGCIGADIRTGLLHRIPAPRRRFNLATQAMPVSVPNGGEPVGFGNRADSMPTAAPVALGLSPPPAAAATPIAPSAGESQSPLPSVATQVSQPNSAPSGVVQPEASPATVVPTADSRSVPEASPPQAYSIASGSPQSPPLEASETDADVMAEAGTWQLVERPTTTAETTPVVSSQAESFASAAAAVATPSPPGVEGTAASPGVVEPQALGASTAEQPLQDSGTLPVDDDDALWPPPIPLELQAAAMGAEGLAEFEFAPGILYET
mmetsp:Transcript_6103/g.13540  ORF Transcript_6103/g.13540 Transcript_6103/m.13540 type:complete len:446 (-) Transcript_6103:95-1432(-)